MKPDISLLLAIVFSWLFSTMPFAGGCSRKSDKKPGEKSSISSANAPDDVHNRLDLPVQSRPALPQGLAPGMEVWALLPYPSHPQRYRLAPGRLVRLEERQAVVENGNTRTGGIPYSLIFVRRDAGAKPGDFVIAAGTAGVYGGRVHSREGQTLRVSRIWRGEARMETLPASDAIVQKGTREPGQIVFFQDRGIWSQGLLLLLEERHAWVVESFGGSMIRVGEVEIEPWKPSFSPQIGQEVEVCRGSASHLVKAVIFGASASGLAYDVRFSNGSSRKNVPIWEMLPSETLLQQLGR